MTDILRQAGILKISMLMIMITAEQNSENGMSMVKPVDMEYGTMVYL